MIIENIPIGKEPPWDINVIILTPTLTQANLIGINLFLTTRVGD